MQTCHRNYKMLCGYVNSYFLVRPGASYAQNDYLSFFKRDPRLPTKGLCVLRPRSDSRYIYTSSITKNKSHYICVETCMRTVCAWRYAYTWLIIETPDNRPLACWASCYTLNHGTNFNRDVWSICKLRFNCGFKLNCLNKGPFCTCQTVYLS